MRLFTGISLPPDLAGSLEQVLGELCSTAPLNWSSVEKLHITTKFIGEWPQEKLPELVAKLQGIKQPALHIHVAKFGYFPNPHRPHILFASVQSNPALNELADCTDATVAQFGIKREDHPYTPHVTLARIANQNLIALREKIASLASQDFGSFESTAFHLYVSEASSYKILETFPLVKEAPIE